VTFAILLDENFPRAVAEGLATNGQDVMSIATAAPGLAETPDGHFAVITRDGMRLRPFAVAPAVGN
jgi:hypothetical protein